MENKRSVTLLLLACLGLASGAATAREANTDTATMHANNTLIVYLSRTDNTRAVAEIIHDAVGGTLVELELKTPYPKNYDAIVAQVVREDESGYLPPLATHIANFAQYDTVFIGFPTWNMQLPPPIKSFLHEHDLRGKTVIPFNTNGGYGTGSSFQQVKSLCTGCNVLEGFSTKGGLERDGIFLAIKGHREEAVRGEVHTWLRDIGMFKPSRPSRREAAGRWMRPVVEHPDEHIAGGWDAGIDEISFRPTVQKR